MSQENVELVMSGYDDVQRGDYESALEAADEDMLWDMSGFGLPDLALTLQKGPMTRGQRS